MKKTQKIALTGILASVSSVILIAYNFIPIGTFTMPTLAGMVNILIRHTTGSKFAIYGYIITGIITLVFCGNKMIPLLFIMFFGYYPIVKEYIDLIKITALSYLIKLVIFNVSAVISYYVILYVTCVDMLEIAVFGKEIKLFFIIGTNIVFVLYDWSLSVLSKYSKTKINNFVTKFR